MGLHSFLLTFLFYSFFIVAALSTLDFRLGAQVTIPIPSAFELGFKGRAFVLDARRAPPNFRVALSVEAIGGGGGGSSGYLCSLVVFLKETKVWMSDYAAKFLPVRSCVLKLTENGDLRLTDSVGNIGWRTVTSARGVKVIIQVYNTPLKFFPFFLRIRKLTFKCLRNWRILKDEDNIFSRIS